MALRHIAEVKPKEDTLAGPFGRRSDQVKTHARMPPGVLEFIHVACAVLRTPWLPDGLPIMLGIALQVSGFALMTTHDAKRVAQYWLKYTEDVRNDDQAR